MPCGLPSTVTACLFIVAERMGKQKVFVKKLDVIETLGSCSLICTDKTGTLTENRMSVSHVWLMGGTMNRGVLRIDIRLLTYILLFYQTTTCVTCRVEKKNSMKLWMSIGL